MAATSIFFQGQLIREPGAYTEIDASGLEVVGPGASGIVALRGESIGGIPYSAITRELDVTAELPAATSPQKAAARPKNDPPEAALTKVIPAGRRSSSLATAPESAPPKLPSRARPATA